MAAKWTADWENRILVLKTGVVSVDVQVDLYSDWKEEVKLLDNLKYAAAMRTVGGDPISVTQNLGATYFMINGWRIRPHEADHELVIVGNIFSDPFGENIVVPTIGAHTVLVTNVVSNLVDSSVPRLNLTQLLEGVYIDTLNGSPGTAVGRGTPTDPVDNVLDARIIADRDNLRDYVIVGSDIVLPEDHIGWQFIGKGNSTVDMGGFDVSGSQFKLCQVTGVAVVPTDQCTYLTCIVSDLTNVSGIAQDSIFEGTTVLSGDFSVNSCASNVGGLVQPIIDMNDPVTGPKNLSVRQWAGGIRIQGGGAGSNSSVDMSSGHCVLDDTVTDGVIVVRGVGQLTDNSLAAATIDSAALVLGTDVELTRKILTNKLITDPVTGILTIYNDDGSVLFAAPVFEDADGVITYRGTGAERREKLS